MKEALIALGALIVLGAGGYWFIFMQSSSPATSDAFATSTAKQPGVAQDTAAEVAPAQPTQPQQPTNIMQATLHTNKGDITIEFDAVHAPTAVASFVKLTQSGFYDGTKFHRVIKGFMDQGGDPLSKDDAQAARWGTGGPGYQFNDENMVANNTGVVSMANSGPNTNGSQFFINAANNNFLDGKYTVFAKVTAGLDVAMAINNTPTGANDRPVEPIVISSITLK